MIAFVGSTMPIWLPVTDGNTGLFPQATLRNASGTLITTVNLTHQADGFYLGTWAVSVATQVAINVIVYSDSGHTVEAAYSRATETVSTDWPSAVGPAVRDQALSGAASGGLGEALRILLGTAGDTQSRLDLMVYDSNAFLTSARRRIFATRAAALASTPGGTGEGEIATITYTGSADLTHVTQVSSLLATKLP